jgi:exonuclease V gamma subunit
VARGIAEAGDERKLRPFWKQEPAQPAPDAPVEIEISLRDLIEFWKDPAKAFVKAQGVSLWRDGEDDEELDRAPITLGPLESWKIKDAIVQEIAFGDGNLELAKASLSANRLLPRGHLAANAWDENKRSAEPLGKKIRELRGEPVPIACELSLENNPDGLPDLKVKVTGQVRLDAAGEHILSYRAGKAEEPRHFIGPWIEAVFASHAGKNLPTILLSETHTEPCEKNTLAVIVPGGDFQQQCDLIFLIQKLVAAYLLGRRRPLCYAPATSNEISKKLDPEARNPAPDLATAIQQAKSAKWDPGFGDNENEGDKAAAQIAWRDLDPFEDHEEWKRWADTIATPLREWGNF